jgi:fatty acid desaturase
MAEHTLELAERPDAALAALRRAADDWGAEVRKEDSDLRLYLPVIHGLRRGVVSGPVRVEATGEGASVIFRLEESDLYVQTASVMILLISVVGAVLAVLWPFFPKLLPIAPFGVVLALGGWFLVLTRLRTSGPDEFLHMVEVQAKRGAPEGNA